jgi:hypothetical protein
MAGQKLYRLGIPLWPGQPLGMTGTNDTTRLMRTKPRCRRRRRYYEIVGTTISTKSPPLPLVANHPLFLLVHSGDVQQAPPSTTILQESKTSNKLVRHHRQYKWQLRLHSKNNLE